MDYLFIYFYSQYDIFINPSSKSCLWFFPTGQLSFVIVFVVLTLFTCCHKHSFVIHIYDANDGIAPWRMINVQTCATLHVCFRVNFVETYRYTLWSTGIYGHKDCDFIDSWNAFKCDDTIRYAMLIFESMDEDTETRRLSPIAVRTDTYIDLLNGPRDHGWCSGYTCRKRLSLFPAIVPLGEFVHLDTHFCTFATCLQPQTCRKSLQQPWHCRVLSCLVSGSQSFTSFYIS